MSKQIDERVVEMRFDNKQFESATSQTMSTLDKLKQKLKFDNSYKSIENVGSAVKKVDMNGLGSGVDTVHAKFSALQVMGVTALANITNSAVNAGKKIVHALTLEPVMSGFQEYETKINAVQTIMSNTASKGTTMADVTRVLDELNTYADKTIYNFAEMTRNIGTFTAAGVGLEESASAIQGIANLAAASGSNSQQASTAMYQLSQALAAGTVKLMDWNSVVNAGMGGEKFQEALKATAREHGIAVDDIIAKQGSFRESLQEGWISADILNETLNKFTVEGATEYANAMMESGKWTQAQADALIKEAQSMEDAATKVKTFTQLISTLKESLQSGWAKTWELVFGDFEEAKVFFSAISDKIGDVINKSADARNKRIEKAMSSPWERLEKQIEKTGVPLDKFREAVKQTARDNGINIDKMIEKHGSLANAMAKLKNPGKLVKETLKRLAGETVKVSDTTKQVVRDVESFNNVIKQVVDGSFGNGEKRIQALTAAGYEHVDVQKMINYVWERNGQTWSDCTVTSEELTNVLGELSDEELKNIGYTDEQVDKFRELAEQAKKTGTPLNELIADLNKPSGRALFFDSIMNILTAIGKPLGAIRDAFRDTFGKSLTSDAMYKFLENLNKFTESLIMSEEATKNFKTICEGLFAVFQLLNSVISMGLLFSLKVLGAVLDMFDTNVMELGAHIAKYLIKLRDWVAENTIFIDSANKIAEILVIVIQGISKCLKAFASLDVVSDTINKVKDAVVGFFKQFNIGINGFDLDSIKESITKFFEDLESTIKNLKVKDFGELGRWVVEGLANGIRSGVKMVAGAIANVANTLISTFCGLLGIHSPSKLFISFGIFIVIGLIKGLTSMFPEIDAVFGVLVNNIKDFFTSLVSDLDGSAIGNFFKDIFSGIFKFLKNIFVSLGGLELNWNDLFVAGTITAVLILVKQLIDVGNKAVSPLKSLSRLFDTLSCSLDKFIDAKRMEVKSNAIKNLAISIAILAGSVYLLSKLSWSDLGRAGAALAGLVVVLIILSTAVGKIENVNFAKLGAFILSFSLAIIALSAAMKILSSIDADGANRAMIQMALLMAGMGAILALFGTYIKDEDVAKRAGKVGKLFTKLAIAMLIMAAAIKIMAGIPSGDLQKALTVIGGLALLFGMFVVLGATAEHASGAGSMILKMAIALAVIPIVLKMIAKLSDSDLKRGLLVIAGIMALFAGVMVLSQFAGENAAKAGVMFLAMGAAIGMLALAMKIFATITQSDINKAINCMRDIMILFGIFLMVATLAEKGNNAGAMLLKMAAGMAVMAIAIKLLGSIPIGAVTKGLIIIALIEVLFGAMVVITKYAGQYADKAGTMMLKMSAAILILVGAIALMSILDPADVIRGTACITALMLGFAAIAKYLSTVQDCMKTLIVVAATIAILVGSIIALTFVDQNKMIAATIAVSTILGVFAILMTATSLVKQADKTLIILAASVAVLGGVLMLLAQLPVENVVGSAAALSTLMLSLAVAFAVIGTFGKTITPQTVAALLIMSAAIALVGLVVGALQLMNIAPTIGTATALSILLLAMSAACVILAGVGAVAPYAIAGAGALDAVILVLGALVVGLGALFTKFSGLEALMDSGLAVLEKLGTGLGRAMGSFVTGFLTESMNTLPMMGVKLSQFMTNLGPFLTGMNSINPQAAEGCKTLAQAIMYLTAGSLLERVGAFIGGGHSLADFAKELVPFGRAMMAYSKVVEGIDAASILASSKAAKGLTEVANSIPRDGGLFQLLAGDKNLAEFGSTLVPFGASMKAYGNAVMGIDTESIANSANAAKAMTEVINALPRDGGLLQKIIGQKDLGSFGSKLVPFGLGMKSYAIAVVGIDTESIRNSVKAAEGLVELAETMPKDGGVWQWLVGDNDLSTFGSKLAPFGTSMQDYAEAVQGLDSESIKSSVRAAEGLVELADAIPEDGRFDKVVSLEDFGTEAKKFGDKLKEYSDAVVKLDPDAIELGNDCAEKIRDLIESITGLDMGAADAFKIKPLGTKIRKYADEVKGVDIGAVTMSVVAARTVADFIKELDGVDSANVSGFQTAVTELSKVDFSGVTKAFNGAGSQLTTSGSDLMKSLGTGMKNSQGSLNSTVTGIVTQMANKIKNKNQSFKNAGKHLMEGFSKGFTNAKAIVAAMNVTLSVAIANIRSQRAKFKSAGAYISDGLADGMESNLRRITRAADKMVGAAAKAVVAKAMIHSPSRLFMGIGKYIPEGLAVGIDKFAGVVKRAAVGMVDTAVDGVTGAAGQMVNVMDMNIDAQPTIRPVLDLSDVTAGASTIGGLLNANANVNAMGNVTAIQSMMARRGQNGSNGDVVSAIKDLGRSISDNPNKSYNINGVTYNESSDVATAMETIIRAAKVERRS